MWCKHCRQDVPGISQAGGRPRCMRCGMFVGNNAVEETIGVARGVDGMGDHGLELDAAEPKKVPLDSDDWELDLDMRAIRNAHRMPSEEPNTEQRLSLLRYDLGHSASITAQMAEMAEARVASASSRQRAPKQERGSWLAWPILSIGLMTFSCGVVLVGWSYLSNRNDLWVLGLPIGVVGQVTMLLGLILQLERIWQNNRYAADKLDEVDERLADIKQSQSLLATNHGSASQAFYRHLADGANPSMLLADLKGQLDLLAVKLSQRR